MLLCFWDNGFWKRKPTRNREHPIDATTHHPDRIRIAFDDHRLVANAGLILPATLALRFGLPQLLGKYLDLGGAPGRANTGVVDAVADSQRGGDQRHDLVAGVRPPRRTARVWV